LVLVELTTQTTLALFATVAAIGLIGGVAVQVLSLLENAEAKGCINPNAPGGGSIASNASKGRCVH
jgi:hypothetical protein